MTGDGGFLMNVQEIETAVRLKLPIIIVVWVDNDFNLISTKQKHEFGKSVFTEFSNPNFVQIAESFGAVGFHVKSPQELSQSLQSAKTISDKPIVIAVDVDYSRNEVLLDDTFPLYVDSLNHAKK
jgi:acetolactate synthase-1/2/3 large subunit